MEQKRKGSTHVTTKSYTPTSVETQEGKTVEDVKRHLEPVVTELTALSIAGKQAHWNLRGQNFLTIHADRAGAARSRFPGSRADHLGDRHRHRHRALGGRLGDSGPR